MDWIKLVGYLAAAATTISFVPQALHTIRTKDTKGISLGMYVVFTFGVVMWLLYGIFTRDFPIISANTVNWCSLLSSWRISYGTSEFGERVGNCRLLPAMERRKNDDKNYRTYKSATQRKLNNSIWPGIKIVFSPIRYRHR